jgi:ribosome-interacting GTPase 1
MGIIEILIEDAEKKGFEIGVQRVKVEVIQSGRREGMSIEAIARVVRLSPQRVQEILNELGLK